MAVGEGCVAGVQLPMMPKAHAVAELVCESKGVGDAEGVRRFGFNRQLGHLVGDAFHASYQNAGTSQSPSVLQHHVRGVTLAQRMGFVHVATGWINEMIQEAVHVDVFLRLRMGQFDGGHQVDALQCSTVPVGCVGECDVPIDHGAQGPMPALGSAGDGRIDDQHVDDAAIVRRRGARRRWRRRQRAANHVPRGLLGGQALAVRRRTRLSNRGGVADGFNGVDALGNPNHARHELAVDREDHGARGLALDASG